MRNGLILGFCGVLLSGCQSLTPTECKIANWGQIGEQDGSRGSYDQIARHVEGCAIQKISVSPDSVRQYRQGYQRGLSSYCQPEIVLDLALNGSGNLSVCPVREQAMLRPYAQAGKRYYDAQKAIEDVDRKQRNLETELEKNETPDLRRREIRQELRRLDRQLGERRMDFNLSDQNLQQLRQQLR